MTDVTATLQRCLVDMWTSAEPDELPRPSKKEKLVVLSMENRSQVVSGLTHIDSTDHNDGSPLQTITTTGSGQLVEDMHRRPIVRDACQEVKNKQ